MQPPSAALPADYPARVRSVRERLDLTQAQLAERIGVSFATVNRWENGQTKPARLAWRQILDLEAKLAPGVAEPREAAGTTPAPGLDFTARPAVVSAVAEATRLSYGHLFNPAFATEVSLVDPLPHQRIAVYERMLGLSPLRFLLADDAGAGKTIMTGLYLREVLARRLIRRVLVVPPAGLVGNWEREMRTLFSLPFRIVTGEDARGGNPFGGPESDRVIVSVDTLAGERMFGRLREAAASGAAPYDLVVFDEAHKLAAHRQPDSSVRKTDRYRLAEALAGLPADEPRWELGWSATHVLLLTATPHMGKDFPYYCLWRLLAPDALPTFDAFQAFPEAQRRRHFIRRTKEEMVRFDGRPLYPQRRCDTLSYGLSPSEQALYDATTRYISEIHNRARVLNRSAARLAMSVFQRRLASSTYALMRSFERRLGRLDEAIDLVRAGRVDELERGQHRLASTPDFFETRSADEDADESGGGEGHEAFEDRALGGIVAPALAQLREERREVEALLARARGLADEGEDSKFEKLRGVLRGSRFAREKFIVFTEHRDTAEFLVRRLEGLGFTGQVASIHGGLDYREREAQVELFRRPLADGGANYLVATDAAGEGINLQFCWLMVNYDVPWNPARLEQRMGHPPLRAAARPGGHRQPRRWRDARGPGADDAARQAGGDPQRAPVGQGLRRRGSPVRERLAQGVSGDGGDGRGRERGRRRHRRPADGRAGARPRRPRAGAVRRRRRQEQPARAAGGHRPGAVPPTAARLRPPVRHRRGAADRYPGRRRPRRRLPARPGGPARPRSGSRRDGALPRRLARPIHGLPARGPRGRHLAPPRRAGVRPLLRRPAVAPRGRGPARSVLRRPARDRALSLPPRARGRVATSRRGRGRRPRRQPPRRPDRCRTTAAGGSRQPPDSAAPR